MVLIGRISRTHGLKGHVVVSPETDFVQERFAYGSRMWTCRAGVVEPLTVRWAQTQTARPVVSFEGVDRIEDAEPLAGCELRIPEASLLPLDDGQFYEHQLGGCAVETVDGVRVGTVVK